MHRAQSTRIAIFLLVVLAAVTAALLPGTVKADHSDPALFFTDASDVEVDYVVLPAVGDLIQLRVAAHGIGIGSANTVGLKIVHDGTVAITGAVCLGMYSGAFVWNTELVNEELEVVGTYAGCTKIGGGPLTDQGTVMEFNLTRVVAGDITLALSDTAPFETTFIDGDNGGVKFKDLVPPVIVDTSSTVAVLSAEPTPTPTVAPTATTAPAPPPFIPPPAPPVESTPEPVAPGIPQNVSVSLTVDGQIMVSWDAPASDGGSPITAYLISNATTGGVVEVPGDVNSVVMEGLVPGEKYRFQVAARNLIGNSSVSSSTASITLPIPPPPPGPPTPTPGPTETPTATPSTPTPTSTPPPPVVPTATPTPVGGSAETTSVIDTTFSASMAEWDVLQGSLAGLFGDGVLVDEAAIEVVSEDGMVTVDFAAEGVTAGDVIEGALSIQLGNLVIDTVDGVGTGSISLGSSLAVESTVQLTTQNNAIVAELTNNALVYAPVAPPPSTINDLTQVSAGFRVDVAQVPDGASLTVTYASTAEELSEVTGAVFELAASNGGTLDPQTDIAFAVNVAKAGITNEDLGTNEATLTVDLAWYEARIAEGKGIVITKIGDDGVVHTVEAVCETQGTAVLCTAVFDGEAGGFSWFVLVALVPSDETGQLIGSGTGQPGTSPTAVPATLAPAPAPTTPVTAPTTAPSESTSPATPEGVVAAPTTQADTASTAVVPTATPQSLPSPTAVPTPQSDITVLPVLGDEDGGGGLAWWIRILIVIVAAPAIIRAVMTIVAMRRRNATAQGV